MNEKQFEAALKRASDLWMEPIRGWSLDERHPNYAIAQSLAAVARAIKGIPEG